MLYALTEDEVVRLRRLMIAWEQGRLNQTDSPSVPQTQFPQYSALAYIATSIAPASTGVGIPATYDGSVTQQTSLPDLTILNPSVEYSTTGYVPVVRELASGYWMPTTQCTPCGSASSCCGITGTTNPTLFVTITDLGGCACISGSYSLGYNGVSGRWENFAGIGSCSASISLQCSGGVWGMRFTCGADVYYDYGTPPTTVNCSPVSIQWGASATGSSCCSGQVSVIVTT